MGRDVPGDTYPGTDRTIDAGSRPQFGLRQARNDRTGVTKNFPPPGGAAPELRTHDMTTNTGSTKTTARKAKLRANTVKLRKDGKPDGRSTRLKAIHQKAADLRAEVQDTAKRQPRKIGRPTRYKPSMCDVVIEEGRLGKTRHQIAVALGIHYTTLLEYERLHLEFSAALKEAKQFSVAYWQGIGAELATGERNANALSYIYLTKNIHPEHFKHRTETTTTVRHRFSDNFEELLTKVAEERRANRAKLIDSQAGQDD